MPTLLICLAALLLSPVLLHAQSNSQDVSSINRVGTTAAQFLKIGAGARPIGMGSAFAAMADDIHAIYWNPAGLSRIVGNGQAIFNHAEWLAETNYDFAAFSLNLGTLGAVGVHIISFATPEEAVRTVDNPEGTGQFWDANMISMGVSYARNLTEAFSIGVTAKLVQETIFNVTARGGAFDLGILYNTPLESITIGASISNFGTKMSLDGRDLFFNNDPIAEDGTVGDIPAEYRTNSYDMPLNLKFGVAWQALKNEEMSIVASLDGVQPNDYNEHLNTGVEFGFKDVIFLRGGYKSILLESNELVTDNNEQGFTFGAGIRYDAAGTNLAFDFGWADFGRLNNVKFLSFAIKY